MKSDAGHPHTHQHTQTDTHSRDLGPSGEQGRVHNWALSCLSVCVCVCDAFTVQTLIEPLGQVAAPAAGCGGENKKEEGGRGGEGGNDRQNKGGMMGEEGGREGGHTGQGERRRESRDIINFIKHNSSQKKTNINVFRGGINVILQTKTSQLTN